MNTLADMEKVLNSGEDITQVRINSKIMGILEKSSIEVKLLSRLKRKIKRIEGQLNQNINPTYTSGYVDAIYDVLKIIKEMQNGKSKV